MERNKIYWPHCFAVPFILNYIPFCVFLALSWCIGQGMQQHLQLGDTNSKKALVFLCICLFCTSVLFLYEQKNRLILKVAKSKLLNFRKISLWFKSPKSLPNHNPEHLQLLFRLILLRVVIWQILEIWAKVKNCMRLSHL